jgi:hypothetical protein
MDVRTWDDAGDWNRRTGQHSDQDQPMRQTRLRIRTLMIVVALTAVVFASTGVVMRWPNIHIHDFYITFGSPR